MPTLPTPPAIPPATPAPLAPVHTAPVHAAVLDCGAKAPVRPAREAMRLLHDHIVAGMVMGRRAVRA